MIAVAFVVLALYDINIYSLQAVYNFIVIEVHLGIIIW